LCSKPVSRRFAVACHRFTPSLRNHGPPQIFFGELYQVLDFVFNIGFML
jgi:hypothetical protein